MKTIMLINAKAAHIAIAGHFPSGRRRIILIITGGVMPIAQVMKKLSISSNMLKLASKMLLQY